MNIEATEDLILSSSHFIGQRLISPQPRQNNLVPLLWGCSLNRELTTGDDQCRLLASKLCPYKAACSRWRLRNTLRNDRHIPTHTTTQIATVRCFQLHGRRGCIFPWLCAEERPPLPGLFIPRGASVSSTFPSLRRCPWRRWRRCIDMPLVSTRFVRKCWRD